MADPRIHIASVELAAGATLRLPDSAFRHLVQVLRLRTGERFFVFDGRGGEYAAELLDVGKREARSEEHTSELQSLMRISYAVFCLKKKITNIITNKNHIYLITNTN